MPLGVPVNFDSVGLDGIVSDWIAALRDFSVEAVAILGPDPFGGSAFESFMFSPRELADRVEAAALPWSALNIWPLVKRSIAQGRSTLSPRERECLVLAFNGMTARESAQKISCTERTVNYHLANAMAKLKVDTKMAAIPRACWLGAI